MYEALVQNLPVFLASQSLLLILLLFTQEEPAGGEGQNRLQKEIQEQTWENSLKRLST